MKAPPTNDRAGYTLVEMALVAVLLVVVLGSLALFGDRSTGALGSGTAQSDLDTRLRRSLSRVVEELLPSGFGVMTPAPIAGGASTLQYRRSNGPVNGRNSWGGDMRFAFAYDAAELDDGLDNDGDGLIDDGVVQWTRNLGTPEELTVVLCRGVSEFAPGETGNGADDDGDGMVDERGFVLQRVGDSLRVGLTLARLDSQRKLLTRTLETTLQPRN